MGAVLTWGRVDVMAPESVVGKVESRAVARTERRAVTRSAQWPRTPSVFVAKRALLTLLDHREPLTVVRGPRGYGKTSLVSHWARTQPEDVAVAWVSGRTVLVGEEGAASSLWALVADAMVCSGLLKAPTDGPAGRAAVVQALRTAQRDVCLVIDDVDGLEDPLAEADLLELLPRFPGLSLVLCMRDLTSVETVLAATIDSVVIRPVDLLLDEQETGELAERLGFALAEDEVRRLWLDTAGWPALIRAILMNRERPRPDCSEVEVDLQAGGPFLYSVWAGLTDWQLQRFVLRTAVLDEFTVAEAQFCTGLRDVDGALQVLLGAGLLVAERAPDTVVYRYLPVVRWAALEALSRLDARQFRVASRRGAQSCTAMGRTAVALRLLAGAGLWEDAARLVNAFWVELVAESPQEIAETVAAMPKEVLDRHARLVIARDHLLPLHRSAGEVSEGGCGLDPAAIGPRSGVRGEVLVLPGVAQAMERSLAQIAMLRLTGDVHPGVEVDVRDELAPVLHEWAVTRLLAADLPGALSAFREAAELAAEHHRPAIVREASVGAALACALLGYLEPAEAWLAAAARASVGYEQEPAADKVVTTVRGIIALERIDLDAMAGVAAFDVPEEAGEFWALAAMVKAQVALFDGAHFQILGEIESARADGVVVGLREAMLVAAAVDLNLAMGHFSRARAAVVNIQQTYVITGLARARTEYFSGEFASAVDVASWWLKTQIYAPANRLDFLLILAGAEHARGRRYEAAVALEEAVAISLATGLLRAFLKVPRATLRDLATEVPRIVGVLEREGLAEAAELFPAPAANAQLSEREREVLESLAQNASLAGVARSLYLSSNTVKTHLRSIYRKLGTHSSVETVKRAWELGLITRSE